MARFLRTIAFAVVVASMLSAVTTAAIEVAAPLPPPDVRTSPKGDQYDCKTVNLTYWGCAASETFCVGERSGTAMRAHVTLRVCSPTNSFCSSEKSTVTSSPDAFLARERDVLINEFYYSNPDCGLTPPPPPPTCTSTTITFPTCKGVEVFCVGNRTNDDTPVQVTVQMCDLRDEHCTSELASLKIFRQRNTPLPGDSSGD